MTDLKRKAYEFAERAHHGVTRKFSGESYFEEHILDVYELVKTNGGDDEDQIVALLHDTFEDVEWVTEELLIQEFGEVIAKRVINISNDPVKLKELGKTKYLIQKLHNLQEKDLFVKLCDRQSNIKKLNEAIKSFKIKYHLQTQDIINSLATRNLSERVLLRISKIQSILNSVELD